MSGWIKLHRSLSNSAVGAHPEYLAVWIHLLLMASHKQTERLVGRQVVKLEPGQLVFGRHAFSQKTGVSEAVIRGALKALESLQQITIKSTTKFSVISILKWDLYQDGSPANGQQKASNEPADDHKQECKEVKEVKKKASSSATADDHLETFGRFWKLYPKKQGKEPAKKAWLKLKPDEDLLTLIMPALAQQRSSHDWTKDNGQYVPNASTWLNQKRWEDEVRYGQQDSRTSSGPASLVDKVRERNREREAQRSGDFGGEDSFRTFDGEVVGIDDEHVRPQMDLSAWT